jgi:hypothetical protein
VKAMAWRPPQNPLDKPLEDAVADAITVDLIDGSVHVLDRRDLARRAALDGFRQGIALAGKIVAEMADDHAFAGEEAKASVLHEAVEQIGTLPKDVP